MDVRDRALFYYRLMKQDLNKVCCIKSWQFFYQKFV